MLLLTQLILIFAVDRSATVVEMRIGSRHASLCKYPIPAGQFDAVNSTRDIFEMYPTEREVGHLSRRPSLDRLCRREKSALSTVHVFHSNPVSEEVPPAVAVRRRSCVLQGLSIQVAFASNDIWRQILVETRLARELGPFDEVEDVNSDLFFPGFDRLVMLS